MLDPMLQTMFEATVVPVLKGMPTDQLEEMRAYLDDKLNAILTERYHAADAKAAADSALPPAK